MKDRLWKNFENTGSVTAYLEYKRISKEVEKKLSWRKQ